MGCLLASSPTTTWDCPHSSRSTPAKATVSVPFANIAAPLIIWLIKRDESRFIELHARESLNFQISMTIYLAIAALMVYVLIGYLLVPLLVIFQMVVVVLAALKASRGEICRYPLSLRFVS